MKELKLSKDILTLDGIDEKRIDWNYYSNSNLGVPRVSHILKQCRDSEFLINWAANVGRKKYDYFREKALDIGTIVHEILDKYIDSKYIHPSILEFKVDYDEIEPEYRDKVYNSFENFKLWENRLYSYGGKIEDVLGFEIPLTCPWFGGTADIIFKINGVWYIGDFKTSKQISAEYLLQVCAYMWIINNGYVKGLPKIGGVGIIRVDKNKFGVVDDYFLTDFDSTQHNYIIAYQNCFMSYVDTFYRTINTNYIFDIYKSDYNPEYIYGVE